MLPKLKDRIIKQTSLDATNAALVCAAGGFCLGMGGAMLGSLVDIVRNKRNCSSGFTGSELVGFYSGAIAALPLTLAAGALGAALGPFHAVAVCVSRSRYELSKQEQVWFAKFGIPFIWATPEEFLNSHLRRRYSASLLRSSRSSVNAFSSRSVLLHYVCDPANNGKRFYRVCYQVSKDHHPLTQLQTFFCSDLAVVIWQFYQENEGCAAKVVDACPCNHCKTNSK